MSKEELRELKREFWKNNSKINGRKATKEEKTELRKRNREIMEIIGLKCKDK